MDNTNAVAMFPNGCKGADLIKHLIGSGELDKIMDDEAEKIGEDFDPTVGNVFTYVTRCMFRAIMGDELFYKNLDGLDKETVDFILTEAGEKISAYMANFANDEESEEPTEE